jgi:DNA-binding transcriptional LysR family regulator
VRAHHGGLAASAQAITLGETADLQNQLMAPACAYRRPHYARERIAEGRLIRVLADWCPPISGYHLYYPAQRQRLPAFSVLVEALRYRGPARAMRKS